MGPSELPGCCQLHCWCPSRAAGALTELLVAALVKVVLVLVERPLDALQQAAHTVVTEHGGSTSGARLGRVRGTGGAAARGHVAGHVFPDQSRDRGWPCRR